MIKRLMDVIVALFGLLLSSVFILPAILCVWLYDFHSPFYISKRVGKDGKDFKMYKLRSMVVDADKNAVDSTAADDPRVTPIGRLIRRYKLDEFVQLINVLKGDMSLVGPRPNVRRETELYTDVESTLLSIRPGITDFSSIVFSDLAEILEKSSDPNIAYNQLVRPWKSRLGLVYIEHQSLLLDVKLILATIVSLFSRKRALRYISCEVKKMNTSDGLYDLVQRNKPLKPLPPPGADEIVRSRNS